jgi:hypothetical protein
LTVTEYREITKPNGSTGFEEVQVFTDELCKLSFSTLQTTNQDDADAKIVQVTKLFCDDGIQIKAGSKISIERKGKTFEFSQSGEPGIFTLHQEIVLVPFRGWA